MVRVAEYTTKTKRRPSELVIRFIADGQRSPELAVFCGVTVREARKIAAEHGAKCWNF